MLSRLSRSAPGHCRSAAGGSNHRGGATGTQGSGLLLRGCDRRENGATRRPRFGATRFGTDFRSRGRSMRKPCARWAWARAVRASTPPPPPATQRPVEEMEANNGESATQSAEISPPPGYGSGPTYGPGPTRHEPRAGVSGVFVGTPYEMAPPDLQRHVIVGTQTLLARYGFYRSGIDGEFGPGTEAAVRAFQARARLLPDGRLNMATLAALGLLPGQHPPGCAAPRRLLGQPVYRGEWIPNR